MSCLTLIACYYEREMMEIGLSKILFLHFSYTEPRDLIAEVHFVCFVSVINSCTYSTHVIYDISYMLRKQEIWKSIPYLWAFVLHFIDFSNLFHNLDSFSSFIQCFLHKGDPLLKVNECLIDLRETVFTSKKLKNISKILIKLFSRWSVFFTEEWFLYFPWQRIPHSDVPLLPVKVFPAQHEQHLVNNT